MLQKLLLAIVLTGSAALYAQNGSICIEAYNDLNANGVKEESETGIEGINIDVIAAPPSFIEPVPYGMVTGDGGIRCITNLDNGVYDFAVDLPEGWAVTNSQSPYFSITVNNGGQNTFRLGLSNTMAAPQDDGNKFAVYPNPASSVLTIETLNDTGGTVEIYDLSGKHLATYAITTSFTAINVNAMLPGIYVASIASGREIANIKFAVKK